MSEAPAQQQAVKGRKSNWRTEVTAWVPTDKADAAAPQPSHQGNVSADEAYVRGPAGGVVAEKVDVSLSAMYTEGRNASIQVRTGQRLSLAKPARVTLGLPDRCKGAYLELWRDARGQLWVQRSTAPQLKPAGRACVRRGPGGAAPGAAADHDDDDEDDDDDDDDEDGRSPGPSSAGAAPEGRLRVHLSRSGTVSLSQDKYVALFPSDPCPASLMEGVRERSKQLYKGDVEALCAARAGAAPVAAQLGLRMAVRRGGRQRLLLLKKDAREALGLPLSGGALWAWRDAQGQLHMERAAGRGAGGRGGALGCEEEEEEQDDEVGEGEGVETEDDDDDEEEDEEEDVEMEGGGAARGGEEAGGWRRRRRSAAASPQAAPPPRCSPRQLPAHRAARQGAGSSPMGRSPAAAPLPGAQSSPTRRQRLADAAVHASQPPQSTQRQPRLRAAAGPARPWVLRMHINNAANLYKSALTALFPDLPELRQRMDGDLVPVLCCVPAGAQGGGAKELSLVLQWEPSQARFSLKMTKVGRGGPIYARVSSSCCPARLAALCQCTLGADGGHSCSRPVPLVVAVQEARQVLGLAEGSVAGGALLWAWRRPGGALVLQVGRVASSHRRSAAGDRHTCARAACGVQVAGGLTKRVAPRAARRLRWRSCQLAARAAASPCGSSWTARACRGPACR
jgi:hypothetical protein